MSDNKLNRVGLLPKIFPNHKKFLYVTGLAGPARDAAALTDDGDNMYTMSGCMGAATCTGLGMALAAPDREVCVIAGDGELMMNIGSLATVATQAPKNLTICIVDNGGHGETGGQPGHTAIYTDLGKVAEGMGLKNVMVVTSEDQVADAAKFVASGEGPRFLVLRVAVGDPTNYKRNFNGAECRVRFREAFLNG